MEEITILPFHPSIYNFQKCVVSREIVSKLEKKFFESFLGIGVPSRGCRIIGRISKAALTDVAQVIQTDFRVTQLLEEDHDHGGRKGDEYREHWEARLALHLALAFGRRGGSKDDEEMRTSGFDVDEEAVESSVGFNDAPSCTSKDIQMLKSGTIKMMRLTVISSAPLPDFIQETNQTLQDDSFLLSLKGRKSKPPFPHQHDDDFEEESEETTPKRMEDEDEGRWKLLREKIRQVFQTYEIHVGERLTLVDLRKCPLASLGRWGCPSASFIFVEECVFRNPGTDVGKVTSKTEILINHVHHISHYERQVGKEVLEEEMAGVENAQQVLTSLIEMQKRGRGEELGKCLDNFYSHGLLIAGPSGCGKSLVVRETVKKLRANLLVFNPLTRTDLTALGNSWSQMFQKAVLSSVVCPTVLLIPKLEDSLLIKQQNKRNSAAKLLNHVCNLFDAVPKNAKILVVATTCQPFLIPPKLRRAGRLEKEVYIGTPSEEERLKILKSLSRSSIPSLNKLDLDSVARKTPGYVGQDLIRLAHLAILKSYEEHCPQVDDAHIKYALSRILPSVLQGSLGVVGVGIHQATTLDHIAGLESVKQDLIKAIVWPLKYPHAFRTMGITPPKGILLHSPPGCAKTTLVRAVAASHQTNFLSVSAAELFSSGVGESEKIVADLFHRARMASPCILFIDELEAIVGSRQMSGKKEKSTNESILSMLLTEMDGIGSLSPTSSNSESDASKAFGPLVLVVAATNRIDMIDSALIRPGRFDKLIYVPPLDNDGRAELLRICSQTTPFSSDVDFDDIASITENFTGADIINLVREASLMALSEDMNTSTVSNKHISQALSHLSPSLS